MSTQWRIVILFFSTFSYLLFCAQKSDASQSTRTAIPIHIIIDPGHGGIDSGAMTNNIKESDITLKVSQYLKGILEGDPQFQVSLTRTNDHMLSLEDRIKYVEQKKGDILISIHANSSFDKRTKGLEIYFQNQLPPDEEVLFLAANENKVAQIADPKGAESFEPSKKNDILSIVEDLKRQKKIKDSHKLSQSLLENWQTSAENQIIRQAPFYMVSMANIPSILIELGFLTNPKEFELLTNPLRQQEIAQKIYAGILHYTKNMEKKKITKFP